VEEKKVHKEVRSKRISKEKMEELTKKIDEELERFIKEGKYKEVLIMMGNLGRYSLNNQIYILMHDRGNLYLTKREYNIHQFG